jgi:hypothetical protein
MFLQQRLSPVFTVYREKEGSFRFVFFVSELLFRHFFVLTEGSITQPFLSECELSSILSFCNREGRQDLPEYKAAMLG